MTCRLNTAPGDNYSRTTANFPIYLLFSVEFYLDAHPNHIVRKSLRLTLRDSESGATVRLPGTFLGQLCLSIDCGERKFEHLLLDLFITYLTSFKSRNRTLVFYELSDFSVTTDI